ncbi:MAG: chromosome partitioning protein [Candidatus Marinimicrobia bacterium]|jgi:ATP-binding protein involved in chromosome partitioning|nr:chromosome partitioning protein [Candidatus Neomarinimicrobiota bacterium]|tara:strand:- start:1247 stop:2374 length:1128 start_codon:yes stop_codon:yes gene_type:complete
MNKQNVLELLKEINYPGFSRDIVSFGMIQDVDVDGTNVTLQLKITTEKEEKKQAVVNAIKDKLSSKGNFENIRVELIDQGAQAIPASQAAAPGPAPLAGVKHIVAIASGKGGVGKSTVAANIAIALTQKGHKVGLLDLDIYGPSLPIILGINESPKLTQDKKLIPLDRYGMKVMSFGFISGNQTPTIWRGPLVGRMTEQFFQDVIWGDLDYLILDLPPGTGDIQLTLTQKLRLSGAVIVTTPQDIALSDVRKGADMFRKVQTPVLGVVENMSGLVIEGQISGVNADMNMKISGLEDSIVVDDDGRFQFRMDIFKKGGGISESNRLGVPLLGEIAISKDLMTTTDSGDPIVQSAPDSPISAVFMTIAERIVTAVQS